MKKLLIMFLLMLMTCSAFAGNGLHDNNKIVKGYDGSIIEQKENKIDDKIRLSSEDKNVIKENNIYYNKHGGLIRSDLDNATIIIKDKLVSVRGYNKSDEDFEVSMYVGTDNINYAIYHHNTSTDYNFIMLNGEYLGDVVSKEGYLYYDTDKFSSQIATIPSHYSEGEIELNGGIWSSTVDDELDIDLEDYFTGVKKFTICDNFFCDNSGTIPSTETIYNGLISLTRANIYYEVDTLDNYQDQLINIIFRSGYNSNNDIDYNRGFGAFNDELQVQVIGDDDSYYYSGFYLTYFFPDEAVQYGQQSTNPVLDTTNYIFLLEDNDAFVSKGFSSTLIELDDDENFGFKINEHFLNYDTWGIRLSDELGDPIANSHKELERYIDGCLSYTGSDIEVQICSDNYKADMIYIRPQGVSFEGEIEIYACNNEYDSCATEKAYTIDIDISSPAIAPVLIDNITDLNIGFYEYDSIDLDDYFSGYTSFTFTPFGESGTSCDITKTKNVGSPSTCTVDGATIVVYPSGLITFEGTNIPYENDISIVLTNSYGTNSDTFNLNVGDSSGLLTDLVAYWTLNNTMEDSSGNGYTLSNTNADVTNNGIIGEGYNFNGVSSKLYTDTSFELDSISLWFESDITYTSSSTSHRGIFGDLSGIKYLYLGSVSGSFSNELITLRTESGNFQYWTSTELGFSSITSDIYHNIILVWDTSNSKYRLYYDGDDKGLANEYGGSNKVLLSDLYLGTRNSAEYFNGTLDEIGIWDKELNISDVETIYNSGDGSSYGDFGSSSSSLIPPGITSLTFDDIVLLPTGVRTFDMNQYFYGYSEIELKYYSENLEEWFVIDLNTSETLQQNILGDIIIQLDVGNSENGTQTIFATIKGQNLEYDDLVYITAINEVGATTPQTFNVEVDYTIPDETFPEYYNTFSNIGLEYDDVENLNMNDYYNYYDYITLSIGSEERTVYLNGSNDYDEIITSDYNVTLENIGTYIALTILSNSNDEEFTIGLTACNEFGCDSERTFTTTISEEGVPATDVPSWFPNPEESSQKYIAITVIIIFVLGMAFIGASDTGENAKGLLAFAIIGTIALFLLFSFIGWLPIWILIIFIIGIILVITMIIKNMIGGN